ncbi:MAG: TetR/AcrR family transcriptional regulator [Polyangiaceae bacterium]
MSSRRPRAKRSVQVVDASDVALSQAERSEERRREILKAALECFTAGGLEELRVANILERSGASVGSVYHHFKNLAGVLSALYQSLLADYRAALLERLAAEQAAEGWIGAVVQHHIRWSLEHAAAADFLHRARHLLRGDKDLRSGTAEFLAALSTQVDRFVERGELRRLPNQLYVPVLLGPAQEWVRLYFSRRTNLHPNDAARELAAAAWRSVCP